MHVTGKYFCGNEISRYGREVGYVDYGTLAKAFNHVLNNDIIRVLSFDIISGELDRDVFQWYIVDSNGAELLQDLGEIVLYNDETGIFLWGVTHFGTAWDYVLTDIRCGGNDEQTERST